MIAADKPGGFILMKEEKELSQRKRLLLFAGKLGYQTRSLDEAARKLGVDVVFVTDRCHKLEDPWGDRAIAVHFESPDAAAYTVLEAVRGGGQIDGLLAFGDRPASCGGVRSPWFGPAVQPPGSGRGVP